MPTKDRFMLHVQAAFAEEEARRISERTKAARKQLESLAGQDGMPSALLRHRRRVLILVLNLNMYIHELTYMKYLDPIVS